MTKLPAGFDPNIRPSFSLKPPAQAEMWRLSISALEHDPDAQLPTPDTVILENYDPAHMARMQ